MEAKGAIFRWRWLLLDRWVRPPVTHLALPHGLPRGRHRLRLKDQAERSIPDEIFEKRSERWPEDTPDTKEAYYIRDLFDGKIT